MGQQNRLMGALVVGLVIAGCGGGGGGGESISLPTTGPFSLQVVDGPVDSRTIDRVCIAFSAVTVHYADDQEVRMAYLPATSEVSPATHCTLGEWDGTGPAPPVRLDALNGAASVHLVESLQIPTGQVTWTRLHFTDDSYIVDRIGGQHWLTCPSCEATDNNLGRGFKLNRTFELSGAGLSLIADIDLRESLMHTDRRGYFLRPVARVERYDRQGTISGNVGTLLILNLGGEIYVGGDKDTGCAVYVFPDDGSPLDDLHDASNVISTSEVRYTGEPPFFYGYAAGAVPVENNGSPKDYRVALTCDLDDPQSDEDESVVSFTESKVTTVSAGQTSNVDFFLF